MYITYTDEGVSQTYRDRGEKWKPRFKTRKSRTMEEPLKIRSKQGDQGKECFHCWEPTDFY